MRLHRRCLLPLGVLPAFLAAGVSGPAQDATSRPTLVSNVAPAHPWTRTGSRKTAIVTAVERAKAAVVNIHSERTSGGPDHFMSSSNRVNGMGTGIIIDPRGYFVPNHHVVEDVSLLRIRLADGSTYHASIAARSPDVDLALIKIDAPQPLATI